MSIIGKQFVLTDTFDVESMEFEEVRGGQTQEHFGFQWRCYARRSQTFNDMTGPEYFMFGLGCKEYSNPNDWSIDVEIQSKYMHTRVEKFEKVDTIFVANDILFRADIEKFKVDGKITVEYRITIKGVTGFPELEVAKIEESPEKPKEQDGAKLVEQLGKLSLETPTMFEKWNELTEDLKLYCIKKLDFKTRYLLRSTSHTERNLVNSQKFDVRDLNIEDIGDGLCLSIDVTKKEKYYPTSKAEGRLVDTYYPLLAFVLNNGNLGRFLSQQFPKKNSKLMSLIHKDKLFNIKEVSFGASNWEQQKWFLGRCRPNSIKVFETCQESNSIHFPFDEFIGIPSLGLMKLLVINESRNSDVMIKMTKYWLENNVEIGKQLKFTQTHVSGTFEKFVEEFKNRIVRLIPGQQVQIGMTSQKHIILNVDQGNGICAGLGFAMYVLSVVPPKMNPVEYVKYTKYNSRNMSKRF